MEKNNVLGQYLVEITKKNFNFKMIKNDTIYKDFLYHFGNDSYLIATSEDELASIVKYMEFKVANKDFPPKLVKKYTHRKYEKVQKKKSEIFIYKGKRYFLIKL